MSDLRAQLIASLRPTPTGDEPDHPIVLGCGTRKRIVFERGVVTSTACGDRSVLRIGDLVPSLARSKMPGVARYADG